MDEEPEVRAVASGSLPRASASSPAPCSRSAMDGILIRRQEDHHFLDSGYPREGSRIPKVLRYLDGCWIFVSPHGIILLWG